MCVETCVKISDECIVFFLLECCSVLLLRPICHVICKVNGYAWTPLFSNTRNFMREGAVLCAPSPSTQLALCSDISKLDCTVQKVDNLHNRWAYIAVFGLISKWKSQAISKHCPFFAISC